MPYSSDAQRRWAHTDKGEKALGGPEGVNEWDQASKGKKLPEKAPKMADGGIMNSSGSSDDLEAVKDFIMQLFGSDQAQNGIKDMSPTLPGLQGLADKAANGPADVSIEVQGTLPSAANEVSTNNAFADGGVVDDDGSDFLSKLNDGTAGVDTPDAAVPQIAFDPKSGLPPTPPPSPAAAVQPPQSPDISNYINQQKAQIGQYGPQQQQDVINHILQGQNGVGGRIARGAGTFADALMQGVARAGNPGFAEQIQNRQNQQGQLQLEGLKNSREANMQNVEANQKLDAQDPNSTISKATQASQGLTLAALGFDPKTISMMSAAEIPSAIQTLKDLGLKDRELVVAKYKAQIEANQLAETAKHNRAEEGAKQQELGQAAKHQTAEESEKEQEIGTGELEKAASVPFLSRVANVVGLNPAQSKLESQALGGNVETPTHGIPDLGSTFNGQKVKSVKRID